jgi:serine/threonine protein kinase
MINYAVAETLAENQSALICRACQRATGESFVLKILKPSADAKSRRARLRHEFHLLSRLSVPGVVKAVALEEGDGETLLALEDIGGQSLDRLLTAGSLAPLAALKLALTLARTVTLLHAQHVVHKDINPSHIIVNSAMGQINLIGFGLSQELPEQGVIPLPSSPLEGTLATSPACW